MLAVVISQTPVSPGVWVVVALAPAAIVRFGTNSQREGMEH